MLEHHYYDYSLPEHLKLINGAGSFELQILEISNANNSLIDGYCCGTNEKEKSKTANCPECSTAFRLCLKEFPSGTESVGCPFGESSTTILGGSSFELRNQKFATISVPFTFRWTQSFSLILQALDMYRNSSSPAIIEEVAYSGTISPPSEWIVLENSNQLSKNALIKYKIRVICDKNYYNSTCTVLCKPRNDQFGHYTCNNKGQKVCLEGWSGETCDKPICPEGCVHGMCKGPSVCECRHGYEGPRCDKCLTYPGCKNGFCTRPWECICITNWGGILCDNDLNYCGTHTPCMYGGTCHHLGGEKFNCSCPEGLSGKRCEIIEDPCATTPCNNGATCIVKDLPSSRNVTTTTRRPEPRYFRGSSSMGAPVSVRPLDQKTTITMSLAQQQQQQQNVTNYVCKCAPGFSGTQCEQNIDECESSPCKNGATCVDLVNNYQCNCAAGFSGPNCEIDIDECANSPCQNGGICIDKINEFYCACEAGFNGTLCEIDINECRSKNCNNKTIDLCASSPCKNNGTCELGDTWYRCTCASGFDGPNCEININECASQPCAHGSTCIDDIAKFKCICPPNKRGKRCEILLSNTPAKQVHFSIENVVDELNLCNSCIIGEHNEMQCSNLWCGLPNCISGSADAISTSSSVRSRREIGSSIKAHECNTNEVCVPALKETCLTPPCINRGDCRRLEQSLRTAPPKYPTSNKCWPNQATLSENCSRINIILDIFNISRGLSTESYCHNLRTLLGGRMLEQKLFPHSAIILICDIKSGTNDTIEVTVSSDDESSSILQKVVALLGELLSRPKLHLKDSYLSEYPEIAALNAIIEIKVETAIINENIKGDVYMLVIFVGIVLLIISSIVYIVCLWHTNHPICSRQSEIDLSVTDTTRCHDEEKSNNLQNEENFRRYANPLKNSTCSLRSSNVELNPIHDLAGPSNSMNRSQLSIFKAPKDFSSNDFETTKAAHFNTPSSMFLKTQNFDLDKKNTIENQQMNKDFDKRINKVDFKRFSSSPQHNFNSSSSNIHQTTINNSNDTLTLHI